MIRFDDALELVAQAARPLGTETVSIVEAHGRVLAAPVTAGVSAPPFDASAMDGYAVRDANLAELPARLEIAAEAFAGALPGMTLPPGRCMRVFTGAPVPAGADRVVMQEDVVRDGDVAIFAGPPGIARHIRRAKSDFAAGDVLLGAGRLIDPRAMVAAAGADIAALDVYRRPRVIILGTGDELAEPGSAKLTPGAIPESVSYGIAALAREWGAEVVARRRLKDELEAMEAEAERALDQADLVVVTGGASVGEKDFAKAMFAPSGLDLIFDKVAIKPGKPVWFGRARQRLVMGLPGNPTSALVTARLLLAPLLAGLTGRAPAEALGWRQLALAEGIEACGARETFVRARHRGGQAEPLVNQDSSAQRTLAEADLLIRRRRGAPAARAGETVDALDF